MLGFGRPACSGRDLRRRVLREPSGRSCAAPSRRDSRCTAGPGPSVKAEPVGRRQGGAARAGHRADDALHGGGGGPVRPPGHLRGGPPRLRRRAQGDRRAIRKISSTISLSLHCNIQTHSSVACVCLPFMCRPPQGSRPHHALTLRESHDEKRVASAPRAQLDPTQPGLVHRCSR